MQFEGILTGWFVLLLVQIIQTADVCTKEVISQNWNKCDETYLVSSVKDIGSMRKMCENVECLVQCKINAVGDCAHKQEFRKLLFEFEPEKWTVYYRFTCSNLDAVEEQFSGKCKNNKICSPEQVGKFNPQEEDKNVLCSSLETNRKCISMGPALNCTSLGAKFQEDIRKIGYSVSICENTDIKEIYTKYGGPSKCGSTSGSARIEFSLAAISVIVFTWIVTHFRKH